MILGVNSGMLVVLTEFLFSGTQSRVHYVDLCDISNDEEGYSALNAN